MPNAPENYSHLLDAQQKATAEAAAQRGVKFEARAEALANIVGRFEDPHQALQYLSEATNPLQTRKTELETRAAGGTALSAAETAELATINGQLAGTASISADVVREISQTKTQRFEEYKAQGTQSLDGLRNTVEGLRISAETAKNQLDAARRMYPTTVADRAQKLKPFEDAARMAEARWKEASGIYTDMNTRAEVKQAREQAKTDKEQAGARRRQYRGMSLDNLTGEVGDLKDEHDRKQKELDDATAAGASDEDKGRIQKELADLTTRFNEANDVLSRKKVETAGEIDADLAKQAEALTRERSSIADLTTRIGARETGIQQIRQGMEDLRNELNDPALPDNERKEKSDTLYELTKRLRAEENTLKLDRQQVKKLEDETEAEKNKFREMSPAERAEELKRISQDIDHSTYVTHDIEQKLLNGEPVSKEELAVYGDYISNRFIEGGRAGINMADVNIIFSSRPELQKYFVDKIAQSDQLRDFMRERFPTNWERMIDFARNHPGWLMILLAIIVGTAGAAGAVAGPAAGIALGVGEAGSVGGGAFAFGRRGH